MPVPPHRHFRRLIAGLVAALLLAGCAGGDGSEPTGADGADGEAAGTGEELGVAMASFDLSVGEDQRLLAGLLTAERELIGFGDATFRLVFLGEEAGGEGSVESTAEATYLPVPGMAPEEGQGGDQPRVLETTAINGVYEARVDLDEAGYWGLVVDVELEDGTQLQGRSSPFPVQEEPQIPAVGEPAPRSENLTMQDVEAGDAEPVALDSRAQGEDPTVPDEHLHTTTVAEAIDAGRPVVVAVATPVYCASRFCGPLTDALAETATEYADRAAFVHLEVWEDFDEKELNDAAAEWIQTEVGGNEPWVFLVDGDGEIVARWDNVLDLAELEDELDALPASDSATA